MATLKCLGLSVLVLTWRFRARVFSFGDRECHDSRPSMERNCVPVIILGPMLKGERVRVDSGIASRSTVCSGQAGVESVPRVPLC